MSSTALTSPRFSKPQLLGLLVLLATLVAFRNSLDGAYLLDDLDAIHNNATIHSLWPPWRALQPPRETTVAGRPLVNLSLAINYAIHDVNPRGYHVVNLAIHAAAALTLYGLLRILLRSPALSNQFDPDADLVAAVVAGLWAVHPLQTESVTYIVQRAESLCGLAYLFTLYAFARSMTATRPAAWRLICVLACFAGMGCKEVMVTAPVLVLLIDRGLFAGSFRQVFSQRRGFYLALAASWIVLGYLLAMSPRPNSAGAGVSFGPLEYLRTEAGVILHYLRLSIWPHPLILDYNWPISASWSQSAPAILAVLSLLAVTAFAWIRRPAWALPAVAFFLLLAPTSSFYPILDAAFEHRMYLPLAGVVLLAVLAIRWLLRHVLAGKPKSVEPLFIAVALALAAALTIRTAKRNAEYADPVALWQANLFQGGMNNARAWTNLSSAFMLAGEYSNSREAALYAIKLGGEEVAAYANLCAAANQLGLIEESINMGRIAVAMRPDSVEAHVNLAIAYIDGGRLEEARSELSTALALRPGCVPALMALEKVNNMASSPPTTMPATQAFDSSTP